MTGCDYLDGINGIGIKTIHKYFTRYRTADKVIDAMRKDLESHLIPDNYDEKFVQAELSFLHQYVWDPDAKTIVNYTPINHNYIRELGIDNLTEFLGGGQDILEYAKDIALGILNPITLKPFLSLVKENDNDVIVNVKENVPFTPPSSQPSFPVSKKEEITLLKPELPFKLIIDRVKSVNHGSNSTVTMKNNSNAKEKPKENFENIRNIIAKRITTTFKRPFYSERPLELPGLSTCINFDCKTKRETKVVKGDNNGNITLNKFLKKK